MKLSRSERIERKRKRRNLIMGLVLVAIMLFSVIAFATFDQGFVAQNIIEFAGYEFTARQVQGGVLLFAEIQGMEIGFYTDPRETSSRIILGQETRDVLRESNTIVFASRPASLAGQQDLDQAFQELLVRDLQAFSGKTVMRAQTEEDVFMDYPLMDCSDASVDSPVIILGSPETGTEALSQVDGYNYCYNLNSQAQDIIALRDYMILLLRNVIR